MNPNAVKLAVTREAILNLLTDAEVANVSRDEGQPRLARGNEFVDLARIDLGIQKAELAPLDTAVAHGSVSDATWARIVKVVAAGNLPVTSV
ncbi:MAG: hypothetical protein ABI867_07935 [Kofleriaceae bacterium]